DIDLEIGQGETVGLLGHNGSGKSTLLKCIAGILQPTTGRITVRGQLAAMLELGAGMHPELSGRDNIFLNASLLGMSHRDVERKFDEIVAFAELEQFIDNQIRFYSSGMQSRLGFAVAVTFEPDVLLVDEVLAVGDENFQRKCLDRIELFKNQGRTIILVTHAPDHVRVICNRAFVLNRGLVVGEGSPGEAIRTYREYLMHASEELADEPSEDAADQAKGSRLGVGGGPPPTPAGLGSDPPGQVRITTVVIEHPGSAQRGYILPGDPLSVLVGYEAPEEVVDPVFSLSIFNKLGELVHRCGTDQLGVKLGTLSGAGEVVFDLASVPLLDGRFGINLGVQVGAEMHDWKEQENFFEVMNPGQVTGEVAMSVQVRSVPGPVRSVPGPVRSVPGPVPAGALSESGPVPAGALSESGSE
ncbi:MAG: ABC transporter ATP-binding protein, partial [Acidimicrobiales bacterium]